jgi:hypothetical protein
MATARSKRREARGSAWHYTPAGTRMRVPPFDKAGDRIRGNDNKETALKALARVKLADELPPRSAAGSSEWTIARVCDLSLSDLHRTANSGWARQAECCVSRDGKIARTPISSLQVVNEVEVVSGITETDRVVIVLPEALTDGQSVEAVDAGA